MKSFKIGSLEVPVPVIQGGMGIGVSLSGLSSAVANMGGVGVISTVGIPLIHDRNCKNYKSESINSLRKEIRRARELSKGIIGVNVMVALTNFSDMVKTSIEEGIDVIFSGAGLPLDLPSYLVEGCKTKLVPIVSSARGAAVLCKKWKQNFDYLPDAIVVEGPKAGGHLGFKANQLENGNQQLETLVPEIVEELKKVEEEYGVHIPLIAAGGIYDGKDALDMFELGAEGVQLGTRFVATHECDASEAFKQAYVDAKAEDVKIIKSPVGMPGRALNNVLVQEAEEGKRHPKSCRHYCIKTCNWKTTEYCISEALVEAKNGNFQDGLVFVGANVDRVKEIVSVKQVFDDLENEYQEALRKNENVIEA